MVTASRAAGEPEPNWGALAQFGGTIVVLMGAAKRGFIAARLIDAGMAPSTPVAAVMDASHLSQEVVAGTLGELGSLPVRNPAVIVIGDVAAYAASENGWHVPQHHDAARARTAGDS